MKIEDLKKNIQIQRTNLPDGSTKHVARLVFYSESYSRGLPDSLLKEIDEDIKRKLLNHIYADRSKEMMEAATDLAVNSTMIHWDKMRDANRKLFQEALYQAPDDFNLP